jgi:hypothetical protein
MLHPVLQAAPSEPPLLLPVARIPLHVEPAGFATSGWVDVDEAGDLLYVFQTVEYSGVGGWLRWHAPLLALIAVGAAVALLFWRIRYVWRRPRERGRMYCRRCNYDLTPVGAGDLQRCPECGAGVLQMRPIRGRRVWARLVLSVLAAAAVGIGGGAVMRSTLTLSPRGFPWDVPWPGPFVKRLGPVSELSRSSHAADRPVRVSVYALPSAKRERVFHQHCAGDQMARLAPGGRHVLAIGDFRAEVGEERWLKIVDASTGAVREVPMDGQACFARIVAFSGDGRRGYVQWQPMPVHESGAVARLEEVNLETGEARRLAEVSFPLVPDRTGTGLQTPSHVFAVDADSPGDAPEWVLVILKETVATGGYRFEVVMPGGNGRESFEFESTGMSYPPRLTDGGSVLELIEMRTRTLTRVDLLNRTTIESPLPTGAPVLIPPDRPGLFVARAAAAADECELVSGDGDLVARLKVPPGRPGVPTVSAAGEWATMSVYTQEQTVWATMELAQPRQRYELLVWDLRGLGRAE